MKPIISIVAAALVAALGTVASAGTITITEVGSDVVMTGSRLHGVPQLEAVALVLVGL